MSAIENRYEFALLFDVTNGNPNGDPDAGNMPRLDPETNHGLTTDVCSKRKVRNYVHLEKEESAGYRIYMQDKSILNHKHQEAYEALDLEPDTKNKKLPKDSEKAWELTQWMCRNFFDIRTFGAVMTTGVNCGQVRGPVQMGFAQSIDPIFPMEVSITRMAVTKEEDAEKERTMGDKHVVPYGLYRVHGFISANLAKQTGFSDEDLDLFWRALVNMFEHDRSASRGEMSARKLVVFKHDNAMGNAPAHQLFDSVRVRRVNGDSETPARHFSDYEITVDVENIPEGVSVEEKL